MQPKISQKFAREPGREPTLPSSVVSHATSTSVRKGLSTVNSGHIRLVSRNLRIPCRRRGIHPSSSHSSLNHQTIALSQSRPLSLQRASNVLQRTGSYTPCSLFNSRDFSEVVVPVVERVLTPGTQPPENITEQVASWPCSLRILELFASTLVLRQKRCHPRNEFYFSPAYILFYLK